MGDVVGVQPVERGEQLARVRGDGALGVEVARGGRPVQQRPAAHQLQHQRVRAGARHLREQRQRAHHRPVRAARQDAVLAHRVCPATAHHLTVYIHCSITL